jgi:hypothetical protein
MTPAERTERARIRSLLQRMREQQADLVNGDPHLRADTLATLAGIVDYLLQTVERIEARLEDEAQA